MVIQGDLIRDTELVGNMDPYLQIEYRLNQFRTKTQRDAGKQPIWREAFDMQVKSLADHIIINCFDEDVITDDLIGRATV